MTNIIPFPTPPRITSWDKLVAVEKQRDGFCERVLERVRAVRISTKPAYITSSTILNRAIMNLELRGWTVYPHPDGQIECEFYFDNGSHIFCNFITAQRLQGEWNLERSSQ